MHLPVLQLLQLALTVHVGNSVVLSGNQPINWPTIKLCLFFLSRFVDLFLKTPYVDENYQASSRNLIPFVS